MVKRVSLLLLLCGCSCASLKTAASDTVTCSISSLTSSGLVGEAMAALNSPNWSGQLDGMLASAGTDVGLCAIKAAVTVLESQAASQTQTVSFLPSALTAEPKVPVIAQCARAYSYLEARRVRFKAAP
jgi:hypothetical protein